MTVREGPVRQFWRPQVYQPATRVAEPLLAIDTSDFDRCLQLVGASHALAAAGMYGPGRVGTSTQRRDFAADSLQMQRGAIAAAIRDCGRPTGQGHRGCTDISVCSRCSQLDTRGSHPGDEGVVETGRATEQKI